MPDIYDDDLVTRPEPEPKDTTEDDQKQDAAAIASVTRDQGEERLDADEEFVRDIENSEVDNIQLMDFPDFLSDEDTETENMEKDDAIITDGMDPMELSTFDQTDEFLANDFSIEGLSDILFNSLTEGTPLELDLSDFMEDPQNMADVVSAFDDVLDRLGEVDGGDSLKADLGALMYDTTGDVGFTIENYSNDADIVAGAIDSMADNTTLEATYDLGASAFDLLADGGAIDVDTGLNLEDTQQNLEVNPNDVEPSSMDSVEAFADNLDHVLDVYEGDLDKAGVEDVTSSIMDMVDIAVDRAIDMSNDMEQLPNDIDNGLDTGMDAGVDVPDIDGDGSSDVMDADSMQTNDVTNDDLSNQTVDTPQPDDVTIPDNNNQVDDNMLHNDVDQYLDNDKQNDVETPQSDNVETPQNQEVDTPSQNTDQDQGQNDVETQQNNDVEPQYNDVDYDDQDLDYDPVTNGNWD